MCIPLELLTQCRNISINKWLPNKWKLYHTTNITSVSQDDSSSVAKNWDPKEIPKGRMDDQRWEVGCWQGVSSHVLGAVLFMQWHTQKRSLLSVPSSTDSSEIHLKLAWCSQTSHIWSQFWSCYCFSLSTAGLLLISSSAVIHFNPP